MEVSDAVPKLDEVSSQPEDETKQATIAEMVAAQTGKIDRRELMEMLGEERLEYSELGSRLMQAMETFTPTLPEPVLDHVLSKSGFSTPDVRVKRLVGLAAQKFVFDIATDSLQYCKHRKGGGYKKRKNGEEVFTLTMEDLTASLRDHGVNLVKPEYFVGHPDELQES